MPFIQIKLWKGRNKEQKEELIKRITDATCEAIGCPDRAVQIVIEEIEKENWGISGQPASETFPD